MLEYLLLLLLGLALQERPPAYPPHQVLLLQTGNHVPLRWSLSGKTILLQVWQDEKLIVSRRTGASTELVEVERGKPVLWRVTSPRGQFDSEFSLAASFEYHADGLPGKPTTFKYKGLGGTSGGTLRVRLSRDADGMHMVLWHNDLRNHYLFVTPGLHFVLSARGGAGIPGQNGVDTQGPGRPNTPGTDGTDGGNGGSIIVSTGQAPWRDYLDIDVRPGPGGKGGRGGKCKGYSIYDYPDGQDGRDGFPGKVETLITDGW